MSSRIARAHIVVPHTPTTTSATRDPAPTQPFWRVSVNSGRYKVLPMPTSATPQFLLEGAAYALEQCGIFLSDAALLYRSGSYRNSVVLAASRISVLLLR